MDASEWHRLWSAVKDLSTEYPGGIVFIGGIAVYVHGSATDIPDRFLEFSHDGDLYFPLHDFADLRDEYEVTSNRRLNKHQILKDGFEFDIYVEHQNSLAIPYAQLVAHSSTIEGIRVASLEHLLVLKADAAISRRGGAKGDKDQRDIVRILWLLERRGRPLATELWLPYATQSRVEAMRLAVGGPARLALAKGNAHVARRLLAGAEPSLNKLIHEFNR